MGLSHPQPCHSQLAPPSGTHVCTLPWWQGPQSPCSTHRTSGWPTTHTMPKTALQEREGRLCELSTQTTTLLTWLWEPTSEKTLCYILPENASHVHNALTLTKRNNTKRPESLLGWSVWIKITLKTIWLMKGQTENPSLKTQALSPFKKSNLIKSKEKLFN